MRHPDGFQIAVAFDQLVNTLLGGWADETLSARAWRHKLDGSIIIEVILTMGTV